jgi:hypothetical protein
MRLTTRTNRAGADSGSGGAPLLSLAEIDAGYGRASVLGSVDLAVPPSGWRRA